MKRNRKSRFVIGGVAALSCVALAGVGYSTWVIATTIADSSSNVSIVADSVSTDSVTITASSASGSYYFSPSEGASAGYIYAAGNQENYESLTVTYTITIATDFDSFAYLGASYDIYLNLSSGIYVSDTGVKGDAYDETNYPTDALTYAVSKQYIVAPITVGTDVKIATVSSTGIALDSNLDSNLANSSSIDFNESSNTHDGTAKTATLDVSMSFAWGSFFSSKNPVLWNDSDTSGAVTALEWLNSTLNNGSITYKVSGSKATA